MLDLAKEERDMTIQERDHERARRAEAFRREHLNEAFRKECLNEAFGREHLAEVSEELSLHERSLHPEHAASLSDCWECFAASGKIGDYLEFVRCRDNSL